MRFKGFLVAVAALASIGSAAKAETWALGDWHLAGDGNYYSVQKITGDSTGWLIAKGQAAALTGPTGGPVTLASITSADIDAFVFAGVDTPTYWSLDVAGNNEGPNLGGYQTDKNAEPAGDWAWVNGDAFAYTQWNPSEPSNQSNDEDFMTLFATGNGRTGNWNDISSAASPMGTQGAVAYYIAEAKATVTAAVPEPQAWALMISGFAGIGATLRRRRSRVVAA